MVWWINFSIGQAGSLRGLRDRDRPVPLPDVGGSELRKAVTAGAGEYAPWAGRKNAIENSRYICLDP